MWNFIKKFFFLSVAVVLSFTSCGKGKKVQQQVEYKPKTDFLTQGSSTYQTQSVSSKKENIPQFTRNIANTKFDKNIDDIYFTELKYACDEIAGSYIKTKPGVTVIMYSHADTDSEEYYVDDFNERELAVILYVDTFTDTPGACPSYLKIMKLDGSGKTGYIKYDSEFNNNFLCTADYHDVENKEYVIHNINARAVVKKDKIKPQQFSYNICASSDNSKIALICNDKIYIYNSDDLTNPVVLENKNMNFSCNDNSLIVFSKNADIIYLVNDMSELYEIKIDAKKAELIYTFIDSDMKGDFYPSYFRIDPEGRYLYFSALNKVAADYVQYIFGYDTWDKTSDACKKLIEKNVKKAKNKLSDFTFGNASMAVCTFDDNAKMVLKTYPHKGGLSETEEFDYSQFKIDEHFNVDDVFCMKDSGSFTYVKSNPNVFQYADSEGDSHEEGLGFIFNFDGFGYKAPSKLQFLYNQNGDSNYLAAYDVEKEKIYIYSGETKSYLYSFSVSKSHIIEKVKIYWNGNKFYIFDDNYKIIEVLTIDLIERPVQLDFAYKYNRDIEKMCQRPYLFYNEDPDTELWISFSPQGMYALFAVDNMSGEIRGVLRGEYEFTGETSAKLFKARKCYELYEYREQYEKMFMNLPILNDDDELLNTTEIYINFNNEDVRGWCSWLGK